MYPVGGSVQLEADITSKSYESVAGKRHDVLAGLRFALSSGEVGVFVGPSGCGKSTMLRILAGLDADFRGHVSRPANARLGMVFQEPRLLPWRSVEDNVRLAAPHADETRLSALFTILELNAHRSHFPGELSLGLARRVALARAFAVEPELLVLDEPFVSLDAELAKRLRGELAELVSRRPVTTLLVSHDVDEVIGLADRVFLLSASPARVLATMPIQNPRSARTAAEVVAIREELLGKASVARN